MYIALNKEQKRISINQAVQGDTFFCPICLEKMFVKSGTERARHFSHYPKCVCHDTWNGQYDMSDWHFEWQDMFPTDNQEIVVQWDEIRHRADILTGRTVIEFQHSPLSANKFNDRNVFYNGNIGYKVVWLYDMREDFSNNQLTETSSTYYYWNKPRATFRNYTLRPGQIDLFFQIADEGECILQIHSFLEDGFQIKRKLTKDAFLAYVGGNDTHFQPPIHIDINVNKEYKQFSEQYNIILNIQQQRAVQAVNGANLMIAVPGSGKTTVMVARMGYMIYCKGIKPENILAITYTKSATNDIKHRFADKFDQNMADRLNIRTINSLCNKIIDKYVDMYNRSDRFTLLQEKEQISIIKNIYSSITNDRFPHQSDIIEAQTAISYIKNMMLTTQELRSNYLPDNSIYEKIYVKYCNTLINQKKMDFDDQLVYAKKFLEKFPDLLNELQEEFKYICVDEAQDTSKIQHEIIRLLASKWNNIFMVGDEDQSIYRFRAAYPRALLDFSENYINPYIMFLETNYRSTQQIVSAAQKFISKNINRHSEKQMKAIRGEGKPIERISVNRKHEQYSVMSVIAQRRSCQTAVLYRNNSSAIPLIDMFLRSNIPFKRLKDSGENFFTSKVVQDIVCFLRFALNPNDSEAFMQIYYKCSYGFKQQVAILSCSKAQQKHITIIDELIIQLSKWPSLMRKAEDFKFRLNKIATSKPHDAINLICRFWYYSYAKDKELDVSKADILYSLAVRENSIDGFLNRLYKLPTLIDDYKCTDSNPIILSTIHSAKGLEFTSVYIIDIYEGSLPHSVNDDASEQERIETREEERRIFYVAITRAKNELYLFNVNEYGSSLIDEVLPPIKQINNYYVPSSQKHFDIKPPKKPEHRDFSNKSNPILSKYRVKTRVKHETMGEGVIVKVRRIKENVHVIEVYFKNHGKQKLHLESVVEKGYLHLL